MKNIFLIAFIIIIIQCKAQSPVIDIDVWDGTEISGAYYKDVNNYLDPFIGTWIYTNGNTSLKIVIKKVVKNYNTVYYEDFLIGEYQYIENGVVKINTIPLVDSIYTNQQNHEISGNHILENHNRPKCTDCLPNERRVDLGFSDPIRQLGGELLLQRIIVNGQPALKAFKRTTTYAISLEEDSPYTEMLVPSGEYILIKQE